ncbi:cutinase family protein [Mycobacterium sp. 21AC1]|uniref:cutinase family protein n=1 Tax=[Mycobacterium] appelbergii TaxID=2939269 RepID=UPI0029395408|nr:cutinase family protein [Mycobacterium sp. 21AC1]MDV3124746.1 cutinase family protein [Mycobacterium sp. 21AC1]
MFRNLTKVAATACVHVGAVLLIASAGFLTNQPVAYADSCPDVEVVFARGTGGPPGVGAAGQAFVDSLREQVPTKTIGVYAVDYPAGIDFNNSSTLGADDARAHLQAMVADCPDTELVLGGFSQGANVIELVTGTESAAWGYAAPLSPAIADHVAAVVLLGNPSRKSGGPFTQRNPLYGPKSVDLCALGDPICSNGVNIPIHGAYVQVGATTKAATFVADRL